MRDQNPRLAVRQGATLLLVAVLLVVSGGMAALAIDFARVYSGVNEMQTAADAAALAAAERLQKRTTSTFDATTATQSFASANSAFGSPVALAPGDIVAGSWNPAGAGTFTPSGWLLGTNSVSVTLSRSTRLSFGGLLGLASVTPRRSATSWVGGQASVDCIKPIGITLSYMNGLLGTDITTSAGVLDLRQTLATVTGPKDLTVVAGPPVPASTYQPNGNQAVPTLPPSEFSALTATTSSRAAYEAGLKDQTCDGATDFTVSNPATGIQPGNGNGDIPGATMDGLEPGSRGRTAWSGTCAAQSGNDATCTSPSGAVGPAVTIAVVTPDAGPNANSATMNAFIGFRIMCLFRGQNPGGSRSNESCPWLNGIARNGVALQTNNYVQGTIVGYPVELPARTGAGSTLSNIPSAVTKIILVR